MFLSPLCCMQELPALLLLYLLSISPPRWAAPVSPMGPGSFVSMRSLIKWDEVYSLVTLHTEPASFWGVYGVLYRLQPPSTALRKHLWPLYGTTNWGPERRLHGESRAPPGGPHCCQCHHLQALRGTQRATSAQGPLAVFRVVLSSNDLTLHFSPCGLWPITGLWNQFSGL